MVAAFGALQGIGTRHEGGQQGLRGAVGDVRRLRDRFWLNGNYSVYPEPSKRACMEVARTPEGYFVGLFGCPERIWSPEGGYSDPFVPLPVLNLRPA